MANYDFIAPRDNRFNYLEDQAEFTFLLIGTSNAGGTNNVVYQDYVGPTAETNVWMCDKWVEAANRAVFTIDTPTPDWTRLDETQGLQATNWGPEVTLGLELERIINQRFANWKGPASGPAPIRINIIKLGISFGCLHDTPAQPLLTFLPAEPGNTGFLLLSDHYLPEYINEVRTRTSGACYFGGIFSVLGETDALDATAPGYGTATSHTDLEANIISLHDGILDRIDIPFAPWVNTMPSLSLPNDTRLNSILFDPTRIGLARTSLTNFATRAQYKRWIELVDPSDLQVVGTSALNDHLHLTGSAQHEMGRRMAAAWRKIFERNVLYRVLADLV